MAADPLTAASADHLLNYDTTDDEDPFGDKPLRATRDDKPNLSPRQTKRKADAGDDGLGIDEEVQIKKKRKPIAKLDEERVLSAPGIPKLRELVRSGKISKKLRLKGKGHEFSDVARLLNFYQQWLDNLYPRAKFADGLQLIEKVGHSKRMQVMRKEWIDESKPGYIAKKSATDKDEFETDDLYGAGDVNATETRDTQNPTPLASTSRAVDDMDDSFFIADSNTNRHSIDDLGLPEDDELEALLAEQDTRPPPSNPKTTTSNVDSEGEDDLDALLAEQETRRVPTSTSTSLEATAPRSATTPRTTHPFDDDDDEDELDALLAEQEAESLARQSNTQAQATASMPAVSQNPPHVAEDNEDEDEMDDLDALLAEQDALQTQRPSSGRSAGTPAETERGTNSVAADAVGQVQADWNAADGPGDGDHSTSVLQGDSAGKQKKGESQDADGEDFDAEGMFSSSPVGPPE